MLASAHRSVKDFSQLAADLLAAGYGSVGINMRGVGGSSGSLDDLSLADVADDVATVLKQLSPRPFHLIGHALGQVIARATASHHPEVARSVTLLACGGHDRSWRPPPAELLEHFDRCGRAELPDDVRLASLRALFFAPKSDPKPWLEGWWPDADVGTLVAASNPDDWATAGDVPVLILQPLQDPLCVPEVGRELLDMLAGRGTLIEVPDCSHAMLPEQPDRISEAIRGFLRRLDLSPTASTRLGSR
jgi:pimeloyl-ACP methyl ester carboxylesterase